MVQHTSSAARVGWLSFLGVVVVLQLGASKCSITGRAAVAPTSAVPLDSAEQVMFGVRSVLTDRGVTHGVLLADTDFVYDEGARHDLHRVTVTFTDSVGGSVGVLTSQRGSYNALRGTADMRGQVVITGKDGRRLQTEQLTFDLARNLIRSDKPYTLAEASGKRTTASTGFEFTPQLRAAPRVKPPVAAKAPRGTKAPSTKSVTVKPATPKATAPPLAKP